jgi:ribose-phosphate pyrophosphokinase
MESADPMTSSFMSTVSSLHHDHQSDQHPLGGSMDAGASSEEEEEDLRNPELETMITLVGNVRGRPVFIVDDIIDKAGSWIAAAETAVKRGGATRVYCMATHGLFGDESLKEMQECECIDTIVVTNSFPIDAEKLVGVTKLVQLDVAPLLAESIRRNHHGENLSQLYMHYQD